MQADLLPATRPECLTEGHGFMVLRPPGTPEQKWCGTWYRCEHCMSAVLLESKELLAQLAEMNEPAQPSLFEEATDAG